MPHINIRYQQLKDAQCFFDILTNPNFKYFGFSIKSVKDERKWLKENPKKRKNNIAWNYAILLDNKVVGGIGVKINQSRKYIGEIGYFIDEKYWGRGIATKAIKLIEREAFKKLKLTRLEILMRPENKASEKVAIKNKYKKEGLLKKAIKDKTGKMRDALLYAKVL